MTDKNRVGFVGEILEVPLLCVGGLLSVLAMVGAAFWVDVRPARCECCRRKIPFGLGVGTGLLGERFCSYQCMQRFDTKPAECLGAWPALTFLRGYAEAANYHMEFKNSGAYARALTISTEEQRPVWIAPTDFIDEGQKGVITVQGLAGLPAQLVVHYTDQFGDKRTLTLECAKRGTFRQLELSGEQVGPQGLSQTPQYIGRALAARLQPERETVLFLILLLLGAVLAIVMAYLLVGAA